MKNAKLNRQQILSIVEARKAGKKNEEIAIELGVHVQTIIKWAARLRTSGYDIPKQPKGFKKMEL